LDATIHKTIALPPGWAEVVEVDDALDALLARLIDREAPLDVGLAIAEELPAVPSLPAAAEAAEAADAALADAGLSTDGAWRGQPAPEGALGAASAAQDP